MPLPQSEGFEDRFRALERRVNDLFTSIQNRSGTVVASQGWLLRAMSDPATPPTGDVYIYASGGRLWARSTLGDVPLEPIPDIPPPFTGTSTPQYPLSFSSPATVTGTVQDTHYNLLRADIVNQLFLPLRDVINKGATTSPPLWPAP